MKDILGKKHNSKNNDEWWSIINGLKKNPSKHIDLELFNKKVEKTVNRLKQLHKKYGDTIYYAWSSGKDSQALRAVCDMAGIKNSYLITHDLELNMVKKYIKENKPEGCIEYNLDYLNDDFIKNHIDWVFPQNSTIVNKWNYHTQWKGHKLVAKEYNINCVLLGRRIIDGNNFARGDSYYSNIGTKKTKKIIHYVSPLARYSHIETLALIVLNNYNLSPIYNLPYGFRRGTYHIANIELTNSKEEGLNYLKSIDIKGFNRLKDLI